MAASTITKIETQGRKVSVDELVAFAAALNVSPVVLMLPDTDPGTPVPVAEHLYAPSWRQAWRWMYGEAPLPGGATGNVQWIAANRPYMDEREFSRVLFAQPGPVPREVSEERDE
jgi:hypothetical protein